MNGRSRDRRVEFTPPLFAKPLSSRATSALGRLAYSIGRAAGGLMTDPPVSVRVTRHPRPAGDGSSLTDRGGRGWRTWCVTVSSRTVYLEVALVKYGRGCRSARSASGPDGFRTSGSSKSSSEAADITGTAGVTPAENGGDQ